MVTNLNTNQATTTKATLEAYIQETIRTSGLEFLLDQTIQYFTDMFGRHDSLQFQELLMAEHKKAIYEKIRNRNDASDSDSDC